MIVAIQAGDLDKDPAQTRRHMQSLVEEHTTDGDSLLYISQPSTMMDQVLPVAGGLGLDVTKITCDFMAHGREAWVYALTELVETSDHFLMLSGYDTLSPVNRDFLSYVDFAGKRYNSRTIEYERIVVT